LAVSIASTFDLECERLVMTNRLPHVHITQERPFVHSEYHDFKRMDKLDPHGVNP
jgi:hypothetical protein